MSIPTVSIPVTAETTSFSFFSASRGISGSFRSTETKKDSTSTKRFKIQLNVQIHGSIPSNSMKFFYELNGSKETLGILL